MAESNKVERIRKSLELLEEEFARAASQHPALLHDMIAAWPHDDRQTMYEDGVRKFLSVQTAGGNSWPQWHGPHPYKFRLYLKGSKKKLSKPFDHEFYWCGRFHGSKSGLDEFKHLADSLNFVLGQVGTMPVEGWPGALLMLHFMAQRQPTGLVRSEQGVWGWEDDPDEHSEEQDTEREAMLQQWDDHQFAPHPPRWSFKTSLFSVARAAIRNLLKPDSILLVGEGQMLGIPIPLPSLPFQGAEKKAEGFKQLPKTVVSKPEKPLRPRWDNEQRKLFVGEHLIKHFKQPAINQIRILNVFEEEGWPPHILDPFPAKAVQSKEAMQRLRDTVKALNKTHKKPRLIHFEMDGTGEGVNVVVTTSK